MSRATGGHADEKAVEHAHARLLAQCPRALTDASIVPPTVGGKSWLRPRG